MRNRMKGKHRLNLGEDQFGFRSEKGTREAMLAIQLILEKRKDVNRKTYVTFIDLEKAFERSTRITYFEQ